MNLMDALAAARPAHLDLEPDPDRRRRDLAAALGQTSAPVRVRSRRRIALVAVGTAVAVTVPIAVAVPHTRTRPAGHAATPSAQPAIMLAAAKAEAQPTGRYWYTSNVGEATFVVRAKTGDYAIRGVGHEDYIWTSAQRGEGESWYDRDLPARPVAPGDVAAWRRAGSPHRFHVVTDGVHRTFTTSAGHWKGYHDTFMANGRFLFTGFTGPRPSERGATPEQLRALSPDLARLRKRYLRSNTGPQALLHVSMDLTSAPVPPRLRAGIMRMIPTLPGVYAAGTVTDPLGRSGIAYAADLRAGSPGRAGYRSRVEVIFGTDGRYLAREEVLTRPGGDYAGMRPGLVLDYSASRVSEWTDTKQTKPSTSLPN